MRYLLLLTLAIVGCAPHSHLNAPSLSGALSQNKQIKSHVSKAHDDINTALKDAAVIAKPSLKFTLMDADGQLTLANAVIDTQAAELNTKQKQIDDVTSAGNRAIDAVNHFLVIHGRDIKWIIIAFGLGLPFYLSGPLIRDSYLPLQVIPPVIAGVITFIFGWLLFGGAVGLASVFGWL